MQLEQEKPNKPSFGMVVVLSAAAIIAIFVAAVFIVSWRAHKQNSPPYDKHPKSLLVRPGPPPAPATQAA